MIAPLTPAERMLASFIEAYEEASATAFAEDSEVVRTVRRMLDVARRDGWINLWAMTKKGNDLVRRLHADLAPVHPRKGAP